MLNRLTAALRALVGARPLCALLGPSVVRHTLWTRKGYAGLSYTCKHCGRDLTCSPNGKWKHR